MLVAPGIAIVRHHSLSHDGGLGLPVGTFAKLREGSLIRICPILSHFGVRALSLSTGLPGQVHVSYMLCEEDRFGAFCILPSPIQPKPMVQYLPVWVINATHSSSLTCLVLSHLHKWLFVSWQVLQTWHVGSGERA